MDPVNSPTNAKSTAGLYIHVPFCLSQCPYCHFYSTRAISLIPEWTRAVQKEAQAYRDQFDQLDTLYLGGGTPSLLPEATLSEVLESMQGIFSISPSSEITLEANPNDLHPGKIAGWRAMGINRISLGVQSFSDQDLAFLGRRHRAIESERAVGWIRSAGLTRLSLDLIYGLPGQSLSTWMETLEKAVSLGPDHLSCYQLTVDAGTPFKRQLDGGAFELPDDRLSETFFRQTSRLLREAGFDHYEVSNFARGAEAQARHNQKYWQSRDYLGLGPAAHSFHTNRRWWNVRSLGSYLRQVDRGGLPLGGEESLSPEQRRMERLLVGFRTRVGVARKDLVRDRGQEKTLRALEGSGKVLVSRDRVIPTVAGFLLADRLPLLFC